MISSLFSEGLGSYVALPNALSTIDCFVGSVSLWTSHVDGFGRLANASYLYLSPGIYDRAVCFSIVWKVVDPDGPLGCMMQLT